MNQPSDWASQAAWEILNEFLGAEPMDDEETSKFLQKKQDAIARALRDERERLTQENEDLRIRNLELEDAVAKMQDGIRAIQQHQTKRRK